MFSATIALTAKNTVRSRLHVQPYGDLRPRQVLDNIVWDIRRFIGLAEQSDDLTLVALRVLRAVREQGANDSRPAQ